MKVVVGLNTKYYGQVIYLENDNFKKPNEQENSDENDTDGENNVDPNDPKEKQQNGEEVESNKEDKNEEEEVEKLSPKEQRKCDKAQDELEQIFSALADKEYDSLEDLYNATKAKARELKPVYRKRFAKKIEVNVDVLNSFQGVQATGKIDL
ncbi:MAG: hypothetical protein MK212_21795, partial [Saprospiraceae bacterium]|nr:hypothetical protein [Saprospiraceae bacterium]